jgi:hypothetical protein
VRPALHIAVALLVCSGCNCNLIPDPQKRAASVPPSATVAVGATHDVLVIAGQDRVTLTRFVFPVAATALFVGLGRLDAAFYLPGALTKAAIPQCETVDFAVSGAKLDGSGFTLEATMNPNAFKAHATGEGEATFSAQVAFSRSAPPTPARCCPAGFRRAAGPRPSTACFTATPGSAATACSVSATRA